MKLAGELDDRWLGYAIDWAGGKSGHHFARAKNTLGPRGLRVRATRLVTPGNEVAAVAKAAVATTLRKVPQRIYRQRCGSR
jgi:hypothetical protein